MPGTDPSTLSPAYLLDPNTLSGADGSEVTSLGGFARISGVDGPALKHDAVNGLKSLRFAGGFKSLYVDPPLSGGSTANGAYPTGFTAFLVMRADDLTNLGPNFPTDRRTFLGFYSDEYGSACQAAVMGGTRKVDVQFYRGYRDGTTWGSSGTGSTFSEDRWYVVGFATDGETLRQFRGATLNETGTNPGYPTYTQNILSLVLGGHGATNQTTRYWEGEIAYAAFFGAALTDGQMEGVRLWLADRFGLPSREVAVEADIGTTGEDLFIRFSSTATGGPGHVTAVSGLTSGGITYTVDGGSPVTPSVVYYRTDENCAMVAVPLATAVNGSKVVEVTVNFGAISTSLGACEPATVTATNYAGQSSILSQEVPETTTMKLAWNYNFQGAYFTTFAGYKNLFKAAVKVPDGQNNFDGDGNLIDGNANTRYLVRSASGGGDVLGYYPGAEYGRYVVKWDGPTGSLLKLAPGNETNTQTLVTHVEELDDLSGTTKKRYYDITGINGAPRKAPVFDLVWETGPYTCTNIEVMLAEYEGTEGHFVPQLLEKFDGFETIRSMDLIQTNFSNIALPTDFTPVDRATYNDTVYSTKTITRIEVFDAGPYYSPTSQSQFWLITFDGPHGLTDGQRFTIRSSDGNAINASHAGGVVNLKDHGAIGWVKSATEFVYSQYTASAHQAAGTAFTGSNARAEIAVDGRMPLEMLCRLANESGVPVLHYTMPHTLNAAAVAHNAQVFAGELRPGIVLWLEDSNEPWNLAFIQWSFFRDESVRRGLVSLPTQTTSLGYIAHAVDAFNAFKEAWVDAGRSAGDLKFVVNTQYALPSVTADMAGWWSDPDNAEAVAGIEPIWSFAPYHYQHPLGRLTGVDYTGWTLERMMDYWEVWKVVYDAGEYVPLHAAHLDAAGITYRLANYESQNAYTGFSGPIPVPDDWDETAVSEGGDGPWPADSKWANWNREALAVYHHPRMRGITLRQLVQYQDAGIEVDAIYGFNNNAAYEGPNLGISYYGDFMGLEVQGGRGDGSDGKTDNRPLIVDGDGLPDWPDTVLMASVRGGAHLDWQAAVNGQTPPAPAGSADAGAWRSTIYTVGMG